MPTRSIQCGRPLRLRRRSWARQDHDLQARRPKRKIIANDPPSPRSRPAPGRGILPSIRPGVCLRDQRAGSTITAFAYDPAAGSLKEIQTISTLPNGFNGSSWCAEVACTERQVPLRSNRGNDSIAVYRIDPAKGTLTFVEHETAGIKVRGTSISTRQAGSASSPTRMATASSCSGSTPRRECSNRPDTESLSPSRSAFGFCEPQRR